MCSNFTDTLLNVYKTFIPNKTVKFRPSSKHFYNGYLRRLKRRVNRYHKLAKISKTDENWGKFRHERNHYINEVNRCKKEFDTKHLQEIDNADVNSKTYYKLSKELLRTSNDISIPPMLSEDGSIIVGDLEKATAFNKFFANASVLDDSEAILPQNSDPYPGVSTLCQIKVT